MDLTREKKNCSRRTKHWSGCLFLFLSFNVAGCCHQVVNSRNSNLKYFEDLLCSCTLCMAQDLTKIISALLSPALQKSYTDYNSDLISFGSKHILLVTKMGQIGKLLMPNGKTCCKIHLDLDANVKRCNWRNSVSWCKGAPTQMQWSELKACWAPSSQTVCVFGL